MIKHVGNIFLFLIWALILPLPVCTSSEDQFIDQEEANTRILAAYALKDRECGSGSSLSLPVIDDARETDVETCIINILGMTCADWTAPDVLPTACLLIQIDL